MTDELDELWLNERHVQQQLGYKNLRALTNKYDKNHKKCRSELNKSKKQSNRKFIHIGLALKILMNYRTDESCNLKWKLGFKFYDVINTKEQTVINSIKDTFEGEDMQTQYTVLGYTIDFHFHKYKLAIEVDELEHNDRDINHEIQRQKALENELDCVFIRINPDATDFNILKEINKIYRHIIESTKKQTKKSLIDDLSKRLLKIEFKSNYSIKSKCVNWIVKKIFPTL